MRSLLLVPPDDGEALARAAGGDADALVVDVAGAGADSLARVASFVHRGRRLPLYLRVSPLPSGLVEAELDAFAGLRPDGIVLPGAEGATAVTRLSALLRPREARAGLADGSIAVIAMCADTAAAVLALGGWRRDSARLAGLACDPARLAAALGAAEDSQPVGIARSLTVLAASAAGVPAFDGPSRARDGDLAGEAEAARRNGYSGKFAIRPDQVAVINRVFSPSAPSR